MRARLGFVCALAGVVACELAFPIYESTDAGVDASTDAPLESSFSDRIQDNSTIFCGPSLTCSTSNPSIACCVLFTNDGGLPPANYRYECVDQATCAADQGSDAGKAAMIACDDGTDCPNKTNVCCWGSTAQPRQTFCFANTATNCSFELCDPSAPTPCIDSPNHLGWKCVPSGSVKPFDAPLGYHMCVPPDAG